MATYTIFLADLKREAKITGTNLDQFILDRTNESLRSFARKFNYDELRVLDYQISLTLAAQSSSLPQNFLRFSEDDKIYFVQDSTTIWQLYPQTRPVVDTTGYPYFYRVAGKKIYTTPYGSIVTTNKLRFSYLAYPAEITDGDDDFPVDSLRDVVFADVLSRIALFQDSKQYQARVTEKNQKFVESVAGQ